LVLVGRLRAEQVFDEVIPAASNHVRLVAEVVSAIRQQQQIEVLIRLNQLVDEELRQQRRP